MKSANVCICICTYKRPDLVGLLIDDLQRQNLSLPSLIVVDGDPTSQEVRKALQTHGSETFESIRYVPSNHANLPYQRYLGWRLASSISATILLYLDDDLRIQQVDAIARLLAPLHAEQARAVGATANILYPSSPETQSGASVQDRAHYARSPKPSFVRWFGPSRNLPPGSLSPSGHRCPLELSSSEQVSVRWLRGGVMACRMNALTEDCFSAELFALGELGYGQGEDTLLSMRLATKGSLAFVRSATFLHPCSDAPKAYATRARKMGLGVAYSRRLLNDNYRWPGKARIADRIALLKSYGGTSLLNWFRALTAPRAHRFAYAWGYSLGALNGIFLPPQSSRLTPGIDWAADAKRALSASEEVRNAALEKVY